MTYTPVIELKNVTFKYKNCDKFALENVNFQVAQGDFVLLVGYSGSGKSTLLKTLNGLIPHFYSGLFGGEIQDKSPFAISGGEQQLTAIGSALALDPPILVFDEITSHLSPQSATKIIKKIAELNREQGKTVILSEHRLDRNLQYVTKIAYIESGQLKAFGPPREVLHNKNYPLELYPRITSLYEQLKKVTDNFAILPEKHRKQLLAVPEPLTIDDFLLFIKGGRESV